jgi:hypothetical protein
VDFDSVIAIAPMLAGAGLAAFLLGALVAHSSPRRPRRAAPPSAAAIVRDLCVLNTRLAEDASLAALVVRYVERPAQLDRVERVRARAWFDAARRLHGLLDEALEREPGLAERRDRFAPSMGEAPTTSRGVRPGPHAAPRVSNVTLIDPEFMAWAEAMKERRRA